MSGWDCVASASIYAVVDTHELETVNTSRHRFMHHLFYQIAAQRSRCECLCSLSHNGERLSYVRPTSVRESTSKQSPKLDYWTYFRIVFLRSKEDGSLMLEVAIGRVSCHGVQCHYEMDDSFNTVSFGYLERLGSAHREGEELQELVEWMQVSIKQRQPMCADNELLLRCFILNVEGAALESSLRLAISTPTNEPIEWPTKLNWSLNIESFSITRAWYPTWRFFTNHQDTYLELIKQSDDVVCIKLDGVFIRTLWLVAFACASRI